MESRYKTGRCSPDVTSIFPDGDHICNHAWFAQIWWFISEKKYTCVLYRVHGLLKWLEEILLNVSNIDVPEEKQHMYAYALQSKFEEIR